MFFNWDNLFQKYPQYKNLKLFCILAPRNCGKSYSTYEKAVRDSLKPNAKLLCLRNTDKELQKMKSDFKARFKGTFVCDGDFIYNVEKIFINQDGEKIETYKKKDLVGYFAAINTYTNYKSIEAKDINMVFYEEFNEDTIIGKQIYPKFINILKTFERFNEVQVFMLGNKDAFDSDYFINWDITPNSTNETVITEIKSKLGSVLGVCFDFSYSEFAGLNNDQTLADQLAMLDQRTANYAQGFYLKGHSNRVLNFKYIAPTFTPKFVLSIDEDNFLIGVFGSGWAIISPWNFTQFKSDFDITNLKFYGLDLYSNIRKEVSILDNDTHLVLQEFIFKREKSNQLFYDSYDTKLLIKDCIFRYSKVLSAGI